MELTKRQLLCGTATVALSGVSGCVEVVRDGGVEAAARAATVRESVLAGTGYEEHAVRREKAGRTISIGDERRGVAVTNVFAEYARIVDVLGSELRGAIFVVVSTPQVDVFGRGINPAGGVYSEQFTGQIQDHYDWIGNVEDRDTYTATVAGTDTRVVRYSADGGTASGDSIPVSLHVSDPVPSGDDVVIPFAVHPTVVNDGGTVQTLLGGIEHPES